MNRDFKHIEDLLERFFEGQTTNAEERELYRFFGSPEVPEYLMSYKPVFGYFESGLAEETATSEEKQEAVKLFRPQKIFLTWALSAAAVVIVLLLISPLFTSQNKVEDPLKGSYIVRNGERIDNLDLIRPELELTIQIALLQQERADRLLEVSGDSPYEMIRQEIETQYCGIIHQFEDEEVRKEVAQILEIECD